jgi:hypothetical protein
MEASLIGQYRIAAGVDGGDDGVAVVTVSLGHRIDSFAVSLL